MSRKYATYHRVSTGKQESGEKSQRGAIQNFLEQNEVEVPMEDRYADIAESGSNDDREQFKELLEAVRDGEYTDIVMPEISRMARKTSTSIEFIDECVEEQNITIHLLDDMIDKIDPDDPMSQFFAKMISLWMEEERKQTIRRIQRGVNQAQRQGKWTGRTPTGFTTQDGYLVVDIEEFLSMRDSLERVEDGESYRSVAEDSRFTRQTITKAHKERLSWYLDQEAEPDTAEEEEEQRRRELVDEALGEADLI